MSYTWISGIEEVDDSYTHDKVIYGKEKGVMAILNNLDERFLSKIIKKYNSAISKSYEAGLREGVKLGKSLNCGS